MTEICTAYPGEESTKAVGPKDAYHEPYSGYWKKEGAESTNENKSAVACEKVNAQNQA